MSSISRGSLLALVSAFILSACTPDAPEGPDFALPSDYTFKGVTIEAAPCMGRVAAANAHEHGSDGRKELALSALEISAAISAFHSDELQRAVLGPKGDSDLQYNEDEPWGLAPEDIEYLSSGAPEEGCRAGQTEAREVASRIGQVMDDNGLFEELVFNLVEPHRLDVERSG